MPKKKSVDPKLQARLDAKVRPDEPVSDERIYYNMPKKKAPAKKKTPAKRGRQRKRINYVSQSRSLAMYFVFLAGPPVA